MYNLNSRTNAIYKPISMAKNYKIKDGKIIVNEEIQIADYALFLKYDWHLYNLQKDIHNAKDARFRNYLKKAKEIFADEVLKSKPNKRVDLFGTHSVFYYLYGHTEDWVKEVQNEANFTRDLICISHNNLQTLFSTVEHSNGIEEAVENVSKMIGITQSSAAKILEWSQIRILRSLSDNEEVERHFAKTESLLNKVSELRKFE